MSADLKMVWVSEGDKFAGGTLTKAGAAEVNGHRQAVVEHRAKTVVQKVSESRNITRDLKINVISALNTTPW